MSVLANDVFMVTAFGSCFGQRIMLTHHYAATGVAGAPTDSDALDALLTRVSGGGDDLYETLYRACLPPEYTLDFWQVQKITSVRTSYKKESRAVVGTHANSTETANQQAVMTFRTLLAGRSQVSNHKIGPLPQDVSVQDNGLVTAAYKAKLNALAAAMLGTTIILAGSVTLKPCILHPAPVGSYTLLAYYQVGDVVSVMRRRTVGRGI